MEKDESQATLHLVCGKMASGKSTFANELAEKLHLIYLSEDNLLASLYPGEITDLPAYIEKSGKLKAGLKAVIVQLLRSGVSVVLDFPANTVKQRQWLVGLAIESDALHVLHFIDRPDDVCKIQLKKRAAENPDRAATDTEEMFDAVTPYFVAPGVDENINVKWVTQTD